MKKAVADINKNKKELAELITKEMGKTINESIDEVESAAKEIEFFIDKVNKYIEPEEILTEIK